jgi:hypothetical protein
LLITKGLFEGSGEDMNVFEEIKWFEENTKKEHVHGRNILAKLKNFRRLNTNQIQELEGKVIPSYKRWKSENEKLVGYSEDIIEKRVEFLNRYKNEIKEISFSSQSKFHSSVVEEFLYYLFKDFVEELNAKKRKSGSAKIILGGVKAYTNLYFAPQNISSFLEKPNMRVNFKDQDFAIYRKIEIKANSESKVVNVPVVSIECKTYVDKTMLEGSIATAEKIKNGNPYCLFLIVTEWYDVSSDVDPAYSRIDQIYVLRKQKRRTGSEKPINPDVVKDLFNFVRNHLEREWSNIDEKLTKTGKII